MADALSIAVGIGGLISLTEQLFKLVCKFSHEVKDAKNDIATLSNEIRSLSVLLYDLSLFAKSFEHQDLNAFFRLHHVNSCRQTVEDAKLRLDKASGAVKGRRLVAVPARLKWPYSSKEVMKLIKEIGRHKETMTLALSADSMNTMLQALSKQDALSDGITQIQQSITEIQTRIAINKHRKDALDFFMRHNPQSSLEMSLRLRHPLTGLWLTEGEEFKAWIESENGKLWLDGIPGAGKTVLAGFIVQECLKKTCHGPGAACFFFCDYKEPRSQDVTNILSSLASQLARQSDEAFEILSACYEDLHPENRLHKSPDADLMFNVVVTMSQVFEQVLMVVDGLDECPGDSPVTEYLLLLAKESPSISMALLSRSEQHIRQLLEVEFSQIEIAAHSADVQLYVRAELRDRIQKRKLRIKRESLEEEIVETLINGAQGMFRWVTCQIDYICELPTDTDRIEALGRLPPTLNETYERLLRNTPPASEYIMKMTLRLVAAAGQGLTIPELCNAVSLRDGKTFISEDDTLDGDEIQRVCRSLIRISKDEECFEFAHFSVREFLQSSSLLDSPLEVYYLEANQDWFLIDFCLRFLQLDNFDMQLFTPSDALAAAGQVEADHPFYTFASFKWPFLFRTKWAELRAPPNKTPSSDRTLLGGLIDQTLLQACKLFDPEKSQHFLLWCVVFCLRFRTDNGASENEFDMATKIVHVDFTPLHMASILTMDYLVEKLVSQDSMLTAATNIPCPAQCLLLGLPTLLFDTKWSVQAEFSSERSLDHVRALLYDQWMGPNTSYVDWVDSLKPITNTTVFARMNVKFGSARYSLLDLVCRRCRRSGERVAEDIVYFLRQGMRVSPLAFFRLRDTFSSMNWHLSSEKQQASVKGALDDIYQIIAAEDIDRKTLSDVNENITAIKTICHISTGNSAVLTEADLTDDEFDLAVRDSLQYENISRLRQLSVDKRLKTFQQRHDEGWSPLHLAIRTKSARGIELLLSCGLVNSDPDNDGNFPLHLARNQGVRLLIEHGASSSAKDNNGNTIWHLMAQERAHGLRDLLEIIPPPDIQVQLKAVNKQGYTPMALALDAFCHDNARLLLPYCGTLEYFTGPLSAYEAAIKACMDAQFMERLIANNIPLDDGSSPLHQVDPRSPRESVRLMKLLQPEACKKRHDARLPIENLMTRVFESLRGVKRDIMMLLLPDNALLKAESLEFFVADALRRLWMSRSSFRESIDDDGEDMWNYVDIDSDDDGDIDSDDDDDGEEFTQLPDEAAFCSSLKCVVEVFLDSGSFSAYQNHFKQPALFMLVNTFLDLLDADVSFWRVSNLESLDLIICRILRLSPIKHPPGHKQHLHHLLCVAAYAGWDQTVIEAMGFEIDLHQHTRGQSALEFACREGTRCSASTFALLLSKSKFAQLSKYNTSSQSTLISQLARPNVRDRTGKLKMLLDEGADPNICIGPRSQPAVVYHMSEKSFKAAAVLLSHGADPQLQDARGLNAMFAIICHDKLDTLINVPQTHPAMDWNITMEMDLSLYGPDLKKRPGPRKIVYGCNGLHVAAVMGSWRCLEYLIEQDLIPDVNAKTSSGHTCAHFAACHASYESSDILACLKKRSCDINCLSDDLDTPLDCAVRCRVPRAMIKRLMNIGARSASSLNIASA